MGNDFVAGAVEALVWIGVGVSKLVRALTLLLSIAAVAGAIAIFRRCL